MKTSNWNHGLIGAALARLRDEPLRKLRLHFRPLRGGLESSAVAYVTARYQDRRGRARLCRLVVKDLQGVAVREAVMYEGLVSAHVGDLAPHLFATERLGTHHVVLFLEALRPVVRWPWHDTRLAGQLLERLAGLHTAAITSETKGKLTAWDYDAELHAAAECTLELLERYRRDLSCPSLSGELPLVRRVVLALPAMRRELLASFGAAAIHGDVHSGNALVRRRMGFAEPALLDWGRARIGSPLEDVSSWLQSLGYWEAEARRRHDTLLVRYLEARGQGARLRPDLRAAYWLAGASNALAGALRYHLTIALDWRVTSARRLKAVHAARDWLRVLRRADTYWN